MGKTAVGKAIDNLVFTGHLLFFKIRDLFLPPEDVLKEAGIAAGFHVLDFGCGTGSYSLAAARVVGQFAVASWSGQPRSRLQPPALFARFLRAAV